ncbi:MAG: LysR family transcriptional regulator [Microthrixaceae bacterium]
MEKQLQALIWMADHNSFSAAARALGTVQSNVSAHIARLERDMGVVLIDRATNKPTTEGTVVLARARTIEGEFEALDSDVSESCEM